MDNKVNYYYCIVLIIFSLFFNYIIYDEAWIFNMVENYSNYNSLISFHNEKISESLLLKFLSKIYFKIDYTNFFILRLYTLLSVLFSYYLIDKILKKYFTNYNNYFIFSYFLFIYWFSFHGGGVTTRSDSIITALIIYFIFSILEFKKSNFYFYSSTLLNIFSIFIHPNAIPLIVLNLLFILFFFFKKKLNIIILIFFLLTIFYFKKYLIELFLDYQYSTKYYYQGITRDLLDINIYIENIKKDLLFQGRFRHLYNFYPFTFYILTFSYFLVFTHLIWIKNFKNKYFNFFLFLFFLWNAFFLLSPTKWAQHFAIIVALLCLMLPLLLFSLVEKFKLFLNIKTSSNIFKFFSLILILLISLKSLNYFHNNYFLYKFLGKYVEVNNYIFFNKLFKNEIIIQSVNDKMTNKNFYGNPEFKYVFNKANYLGNNSKKIKEEVEFFVVLSRMEKCDDYEKLFNSKYILKTSFYMNDEIFIICEKSNEQ